MTLDNLTNDELLALVGKRASRHGALAEVRNRVSKLGNKTNLLMFRYLIPQGGEDRDDAWSGLVACCLKARGNCYALPQFGESLRTSTGDFVETALAEIARGYRRQSYKSIARLALAGQFRWVARDVRNALVDEVRKVCAKNRRAKQSDERTDPAITPDFAKLLAVQIERERSALITAIGGQPFETLSVIARCYPFGRTRRERKGNVTRAVASARAISTRQARRDVRALVEAVDGSMNWTARRALQHLLGKDSGDVRFADFLTNR